ncbi:hypothetical protein CICLE_v10024175mg, partial [Citrus x clementina]
KCKTKVGLRNIICSVQKEEKGWWKRLLKSEEKPAPYIKVDWNKWCNQGDEGSNSDLASNDDDAEESWLQRLFNILPLEKGIAYGSLIVGIFPLIFGSFVGELGSVAGI